jgi:dienelactone hydrolase
MRKGSIRQGAALWVFWGLVAFLCGGPAPADGDLKITASPSVALYGEPFSVRVTGLRPGERAVIKASSKDARDRLWESEAVFEADASGTVDVGKQAPVSGSYAEADIFGLLWSLKQADPNAKKPNRYLHDEINGWTVDLSVTNEGGATASARLRCVYQMPGRPLVRVPLETDGLYGFLYHPAQGGPFSGVIILGGSNGGLYEWLAQAFASNGFAALTMAYFGYRDLPAELVEIPLEQFPKAVAWLKSQPAVRSDRIGLVGGSKGGELAMLLASRTDDYQAVVGWTPGAHVWEGLSQKYFSPDYRPISSWSCNGRGLPFMPFKASAEDKAKELRGELDSYVPFQKDSLAQSDPAAIERARIRVEDIKAPILLISGTDDHTWPAGEFCETIVATLKKAGFPFEVKHVSHEGGGHESFLPYFVTAGRGGISGGSPRVDARSGYRSWAETIAFLHRHLDKCGKGRHPHIERELSL